jgi:hypothetical protein
MPGQENRHTLRTEVLCYSEKGNFDFRQRVCAIAVHSTGEHRMEVNYMALLCTVRLTQQPSL